MKPHVKTKWFFFTFLIGFAYTESVAQMQKNDWLGSYTMNHDGWEGIFVIQDTKRDCSNSPWCSLEAYYIDSEGDKRKVAINSFSKDWQNINFQIFYPQHTQHFNGYLFSHDKTLLAGTTEWNKKNFGFYAKKQPGKTLASGRLRDLKVIEPATDKKPIEEIEPADDPVIKRRISDKGWVEVTYKSGKVVTYREGGKTIQHPDGTTSGQLYVQVPILVPPMPNEPDILSWLDIMNSNMDEIVSHLLNGDSTSVNNYKQVLSKYKNAERINNSMKTIDFLIE